MQKDNTEPALGNGTHMHTPPATHPSFPHLPDWVRAHAMISSGFTHTLHASGWAQPIEVRFFSGQRVSLFLPSACSALTKSGAGGVQCAPICIPGAGQRLFLEPQLSHPPRNMPGMGSLLPLPSWGASHTAAASEFPERPLWMPPSGPR